MKTVYHYLDPFEFLADYINERKREEPSFSIRKWAKEMNLKGHNLLVMILNKKRSLKVKHLSFLGEGLRLNHEEQVWFRTIIQRISAKDSEERRLYELFLTKISPRNDFVLKEVEEFKAISDWYHMAILALADIPNFKVTAENVRTHLKREVPKMKISAAIERLRSLDLLKEDEKGDLRCTYCRLSSKNDFASKAVQAYHKQTSNLAIEAVERDGVEVREFQSFALAIDPSKITLAKDLIREFRKSFSAAVSGGGSQVYQTNIQFFQLTESTSKVDAGVESDNYNTNKENTHELSI